jgi:hypothetical protein
LRERLEAAALAEQRRRLEIETALAQREAEVLSLRERLEAAENLCRDLRQNVTAATTDREALQALVDPRSWRLTEPLRPLKAGLSRVREIGLTRVSRWPGAGQLSARLRLRRHIALVEASGLFDAARYLA